MSYPTSYGSTPASASSLDWSQRGIGLSNTIHSEIAPCLPLPSLPVFCGASDPVLRLVDEPSGSGASIDQILAHSRKIADLLRETDVSYLNLRDDARVDSPGFVEPFELYDNVLRCDPHAFECSTPGPIKEEISSTTLEKMPVEQNPPFRNQPQRDCSAIKSHQPVHAPIIDMSAPSSKKGRSKKKGNDSLLSSVASNHVELQDDIIGSFSELLEDFCGRSEIICDDRDEAEWLSLPLSDLRILVNEIMSLRAKKLLHMVPADSLVRLLRVLDHQIHGAEGLSIDQWDHSDSDELSTIFCALESIHAAVAVMAHDQMPKLLYKEEIIERILEFSRHQIMDVMCAYDPTFRALHRPNENGAFEGDDDEEPDGDFGSASKKRRSVKASKPKKSMSNKVSGAVNTILQKMCAILVLLKDLLLIVKLSDSCILQLVKTSFTTFMVDNVQLLQLKAIGLVCGIFYSYTQHRTYLIDELLQLLCKLPSSKRVLRAYHLPDEEQRQIQMITALLIQLVHHSANIPESLRQVSENNAIFEVSVDAGYPTKCLEAATEACCLFWTRVLQRFSSVKAQDASELKIMMENIVTDLLTTLNLPEYPASAPVLEVLCVLLLQNAGLKSKDTSARSMAIDILGTVAARLKRDAVLCSTDRFWMLQELACKDSADGSYAKDVCCICLDGRVEKLSFVCQGCKRLFHADCIGIRENEVPNKGWSCQICLCKKELLVLQSYCKSHYEDDMKKNKDSSKKCSETCLPITHAEIVQQLLLNYLQDAGSAEDVHLFVRWFYLCLWYKDDTKSQQKFIYFLSRLKSKVVVRDSGNISSLLSRDSVKKMTLALGQNNSFSRGFDKILHMLLASLRENSPVIRAKALKAVSIIVEADPEVLGDKRVQLAVEGRFCDSAISVREAALELVGRHIASHPDVGFKYFEKIAERTRDTGVSVRKRAIKIIRDMCTSNANFSEFTSACIEIMSRVTDYESSIQDLVCKTFHELWFEEPSGLQTQFFGDGSSVPLEVAKKTEQIVQMLRKMPNHQLLVIVIKRNLLLDFLPQSTKAAGINPVSLTSVRKRCELMCKCLLERILQVEETNTVETEVPALPYVLALHAFCVVDPVLCAPASDPSQFVVTLQPYLKSQADNRVIAQLLESIVFIIDAVLPLLRKLPPTVVEDLEQDLKNMIVRHPFLTVVHACINLNPFAVSFLQQVPMLCKQSSRKRSDCRPVSHSGFFKRLDANGVDNKQQVGRSLFCLGLLIRYGNSLLNNPNSKNVDASRSLDLFKNYLYGEDFVVSVRALQALGFVLIARPEYMLDKDVGKILEATLSSDSDVRLKMQALQNMYEYLIEAESQLGTDKVSDNVPHCSAEGGQSVPVAAGAGDTNICGGIVQLYWDNILGRSLDLNDQVRQSSLKIVEIVLRQGLVHPITCVPHLIALETDPLEGNSKLAHHLLMKMHEKYPAFFESRLGDGLQMSFTFMQTISSKSENANKKVQPKVAGNMKGKPESGSLTQARLGVSRIYKLIRVNRNSRNKFLSSIVRKFDSPSLNDSVIPFLMYCTEVLALLPFTLPDEPLYLIHSINRIVQVKAGTVEANMKALSLHLSQRNSQKIPYENGIIQQQPFSNSFFNPMMSIDLNGTFQVEQFSQPPFSDLTPVDLNGINLGETVDESIYNCRPLSEGQTHMSSDDSCSISNADIEKLQVESLAAVALQLLLKLKKHLKIVYSLNDDRCQAFSPNEIPKPGEVLSRQNLPFSVAEIIPVLPTTSQELVQRYQELKRALKEDTIDFTIYATNIKRKRPTPKKGRRPTNTNAGDEEEDEGYDDDWAGGSRRLSNSEKKGVSTRGSRLRQ